MLHHPNIILIVMVRYNHGYNYEWTAQTSRGSSTNILLSPNLSCSTKASVPCQIEHQQYRSLISSHHLHQET